MTDLWKLKIRQATWRGYPFFVASHWRTGGRRIAKHEYPYRDKPYNEDMGRKVQGYELNGYVLGDDYHRQRDNLVKACEAFGPGTLRHPVYGSLAVVCVDYKVEENNTDGRMASISFTFEEAGEAAYPKSKLEKMADAVAQGLQAADEVAGKIASAWNMEGAPSYLIAIAEDTVATLGGWMASLANPASPSGYLATVTNLADNAATLVTAPADLAEQTVGSLRAMFGPAEALSPQLARQKLESAQAYGTNTGGAAEYSPASEVPITPVVDNSTDAGQQLKDALDALTLGVRAGAIAVLAELAGDLTYEYVEQVRDIRDALTDAIDAVCLNPAMDDDLYERMMELRTSVVYGLPVNASNLPQIVETTLPEGLPAIVLAWKLYGDVDPESRAAEIVVRNGLDHPLFLPSDQVLAVLSA